MEKELDDEDCYIVESASSVNRNATGRSAEISNLSILKEPVGPIDVSHAADADGEILIIAEKAGLVACRDYPHPRHICAQFPFSTTPHHQHCQNCYCYLCEQVAPCKSWTDSYHFGGHCHATNHGLIWKIEKALSEITAPAEPNQTTTPTAQDRHRLSFSIGPTSTTAVPNYGIDNPQTDDEGYLRYVGAVIYDENKNWEFVTGYGMKICKKTYPNPDAQFYIALQKGLELAWSIGIRTLCLDLDSACYDTIRRHFDVGHEILHYEVIGEEEEQCIHLWDHATSMESTTAARSSSGGDLLPILKDVEACFNQGWFVSVRRIAPSKILQEPNAYALLKFAQVQRQKMQVYDFSSNNSLKQLVQSLADQYIRTCLN